ncbi:MAG: glycoside hydrolase family 43 protein [Acidobacteriia bacterium]|nr:glycoside hydrolase family 43 protein [Terriglobia bacterium]
MALSFALLGPIAPYAQAAGSTFVNPLLPSGPDPWVTYRNGYYYYMNTTGNSLVIRKTRSMADLQTAETKVVWRPPPAGPYSHEIWAPEIHFLSGKWYIYFAADAGTNQSHRLWVIENASSDPLAGEWTLKGKVADPADKWAIDASVFENGARMYMVWSGWEGDGNGVQNIYIAELADPWTIKGQRVKLSTPEYPWEKMGDRNIDVNEGPEVLHHDGRIFLIYSASACWSDFYALGMLTASGSSDLLAASSWKKSPLPVFRQSPAAHAYAPGHNGFFRSPDGTEDWIIYHANPEPNQGCGEHRSPRAQKFTWKPDGTPNFGRPVPIATPILRPSGEGAR